MYRDKGWSGRQAGIGSVNDGLNKVPGSGRNKGKEAESGSGVSFPCIILDRNEKPYAIESAALYNQVRVELVNSGKTGLSANLISIGEAASQCLETAISNTKGLRLRTSQFEQHPEVQQKLAECQRRENKQPQADLPDWLTGLDYVEPNEGLPGLANQEHGRTGRDGKPR